MITAGCRCYTTLQNIQTAVPNSALVPSSLSSALTLETERLSVICGCVPFHTKCSQYREPHTNHHWSIVDVSQSTHLVHYMGQTEINIGHLWACANPSSSPYGPQTHRYLYLYSLYRANQHHHQSQSISPIQCTLNVNTINPQ